METMGKRIKKIRVLNGLTQSDFGKKLSIDGGYVSKIETNKTKPSGSLIKLITLIFKINEDWLLNGIPPMEANNIDTMPQGHKIDSNMLSNIVRIVETLSCEKNLSLSPEQKGELYSLLYEDFTSKDVYFRSDDEVKRQYIERYLNLIKPTPSENKSNTPQDKASNVIKFKGNKNININGKLYKSNVGNNITIETKTGKIHVLPPPESIGADPILKQEITALFNKIGEEREKRFGKQAYATMYSKFKKDFGIKNNPWTIIWTWPRECAHEIRAYLIGKWENTISGRIERASRRDDYIPPRPFLYQKEREILSHFNLKTNSPEIKEVLNNLYGITSHKHLTHLQHWQFVKYLEGQLDKIID